MSETNGLIVAAFVVYLLVVFAIGALAFLRTTSLADYILGGRKLGKWTTALSAQASDMSGWLLLGLPGAVYISGLDQIWMPIALAVGAWLNWRLVARRLRTETERLGNALTIPDFLEARFADGSRILRVVAALFILFFFTFYVSSLLAAGGTLFESAFGMDYRWAVFTGLAAILFYTLIGGFLAVSWTDAFQAALMFLALVAVALLGLFTLGGIGGLVSGVNEVNPALWNPLTDTEGQFMGIIAILSLLGWGLGYFGQPHILARFMAIRDPEELVFSRRVAIGWVSICLVAAVMVAMIGIVSLEPALSGDDREQVFIHLSQALFHPVIAGVILAAILAAVMSTADSQLLASSSAVSEDFYKAFLRPNAEQSELLWVGRGAVVLVALAAVVVAMDPESLVLDLVGYAWAGFGAVFGPVILISLLWPAMNRLAAGAGMLVGGATVIIWDRLEGGLFELYELVPGFALAAVAIVLVTLLTRPRGTPHA
ncbi:sodium/proline symporter [Natronospira proteinivora]|uniref:Sodium/proline symporter n=1 Tax=Natronospira proteinivora TaxID=1807133 RepID=A0ABT1GA60_9GAMM|nr:sodium/proline symporter PutP [Natronospira proteinivora]MCP1728184.1 sodium/proline symporter [Natronospira proteinivora]